MTTTIEAMKQAHAILQSGDLLCEVTAASILREAIAAEEAQGVEAKGFRVYPLDFARWMRDNRNCFLNVDVDHAADVIERLVKDQGSSAVEPRASESVAGSIPAPEPTVDHVEDVLEMVPMTPEQIDALSNEHLESWAHGCVGGAVEFARAVEAYHRIK